MISSDGDSSYVGDLGSLGVQEQATSQECAEAALYKLSGALALDFDEPPECALFAAILFPSHTSSLNQSRRLCA